MLCDPCTGPMMRPAELAELGSSPDRSFITRLHVRYDREHFPEDLQFQETPDTEQYQARYVMHVAVKTSNVTSCRAGREYIDSLRDRWRHENASLAELTGWAPADIRTAMVAHWEHAQASLH